MNKLQFKKTKMMKINFQKNYDDIGEMNQLINQR